MTDMQFMFAEASVFNNGAVEPKKFNNYLSKWKVTKVVTMNYMFGGALAFNGDISTWVSLGSFAGCCE